MKILVTGEEIRAAELRERLSGVKDLELDYSDGDDEEDYKEYDCIFDLNFDDDPSNLPVYAALRDKPVFVNAVKLSLNEAAYAMDAKMKCMLYGMNGLPTFIQQSTWEISLYRKFQAPELEKLMNALGIVFVPVEDRIGLVKLGTNYPYGPFEWCDKVGITPVFETLAALFEDTKDERYKICPLLKTKYLRNETFYREKDK